MRMRWSEWKHEGGSQWRLTETALGYDYQYQSRRHKWTNSREGASDSYDTTYLGKSKLYSYKLLEEGTGAPPWDDDSDDEPTHPMVEVLDSEPPVKRVEIDWAIYHGTRR
jgi:hypothetical protein